MAHCDACEDGAHRESVLPRISPLERALADVEHGLLGYAVQPGDSLVRCAANHGLRREKPSMVLSDLLRKDVARKPQIISALDALRRLSRVSSQHDVYNSHWAAPRTAPAPDAWRLAALLSDIELTSDAVAAADADIAAHEDECLRIKKHRSVMRKARASDAGGGHASVLARHKFTSDKADSTGAAAPLGLHVRGHHSQGCSSNAATAALRQPRASSATPSGAQHSSSSFNAMQQVYGGSGALARGGSLSAASAAPLAHDGALHARPTHPQQLRSGPFRSTLDPAEWSPLAIQGTPLGHLSRWQQQQLRPAPPPQAAAATGSTVRIDTLHLPPEEATALWKAEAPRGKRAAPGPTSLDAERGKHLIGHWQRDIEAEAAAAAAAAAKAAPAAAPQQPQT
jgi:hypothetical protein